jgi:hypothetical protein
MADFRDALGDPGLKSFYDYWASLRGERPMPARVDIDPLRMPRGYLPNIMLVDVFHAPRGFRYRLVGTNVVNATGEDRTGRSFDDVQFFRKYPVVLEQYRTVVETGRPFHSLEPFTNFSTGTTYEADCLMLPLSSDGRLVDTVLVLFRFNSGPYAGSRSRESSTRPAAAS